MAAPAHLRIAGGLTHPRKEKGEASSLRRNAVRTRREGNKLYNEVRKPFITATADDILDLDLIWNLVDRLATGSKKLAFEVLKSIRLMNQIMNELEKHIHVAIEYLSRGQQDDIKQQLFQHLERDADGLRKFDQHAKTFLDRVDHGGGVLLTPVDIGASLNDAVTFARDLMSDLRHLSAKKTERLAEAYTMKVIKGKVDEGVAKNVLSKLEAFDKRLKQILDTDMDKELLALLNTLNNLIKWLHEAYTELEGREIQDIYLVPMLKALRDSMEAISHGIKNREEEEDIIYSAIYRDEERAKSLAGGR